MEPTEKMIAAGVQAKREADKQDVHYLEDDLRAIYRAMEAAKDDWMPDDCEDRASCHRHGRCMYINCSGYVDPPKTAAQPEDSK